VGLVAAGCVAALVPEPPRPPALTLRQRLAPLGDRRVLGLVGTTLLLFGVAGTVGNLMAGHLADRIGSVRAGRVRNHHPAAAPADLAAPEQRTTAAERLVPLPGHLGGRRHRRGGDRLVGR